MDLLEQEIVSDSGISWAIYKCAPHPRQITVPCREWTRPLHVLAMTGGGIPKHNKFTASCTTN